MMLDIVTFILSVIAIVLSIISIRKDEKYHKANANAIYFNKIFEEKIIFELPKARKLLRFKNEQLVDTNDIIDILNAIRKDSLFFLYYKVSFYNELKEKLQQIEDYIIDTEQKLFLEIEQQAVFNNIDSLLKELYEILSDAYLGNI